MLHVRLLVCGRGRTGRGGDCGCGSRVEKIVSHKVPKALEYGRELLVNFLGEQLKEKIENESHR
jgi:hypothetical protein